MDERQPEIAWMLGFLAGGVVGAGVALLLAPGSRKETRKAVRRRVRDAAATARRLRRRAARRHDQVASDSTPVSPGEAAARRPSA